MLKHRLATAALLLGFLPLGVAAQAMPIQPRTQTVERPNILEVYGGCGIYAHRGPYGGCRPGGQAGGYRHYACPPGFHVGPYGRRCWPN